MCSCHNQTGFYVLLATQTTGTLPHSDLQANVSLEPSVPSILRVTKAESNQKMTQLILEKGMDKESWMKLEDAENIAGSLNVEKEGHNHNCAIWQHQTDIPDIPPSDHPVTTMNSLSQYHPSLNLVMIRFGSFTEGSVPIFGTFAKTELSGPSSHLANDLRWKSRMSRETLERWGLNLRLTPQREQVPKKKSGEFFFGNSLDNFCIFQSQGMGLWKGHCIPFQCLVNMEYILGGLWMGWTTSASYQEQPCRTHGARKGSLTF